MITHYIFLCSAYSIGKRICIDFYNNETEEELKNVRNYITEKCGYNVPMSTHYIQTNSKDWKSVIEKDKFFENVKRVSSVDEFIRIVLFDKELSGIDVAKYILAKMPCTHLKLEKLLYMCYADYLCESSDKLFNDYIYAYKYGPVISGVYKRYCGNSEIIKETDNSILSSNGLKLMPVRSRIISSKDGIKKLISIDKTLDKYGNLSVSKLVKLVHSKSSPWSKSGEGELYNKEITDDIIIKYHKNEII